MADSTLSSAWVCPFPAPFPLALLSPLDLLEPLLFNSFLRLATDVLSSKLFSDCTTVSVADIVSDSLYYPEGNSWGKKYAEDYKQLQTVIKSKII